MRYQSAEQRLDEVTAQRDAAIAENNDMHLSLLKARRERDEALAKLYRLEAACRKYGGGDHIDHLARLNRVAFCAQHITPDHEHQMGHCDVCRLVDAVRLWMPLGAP